MKVLLLRELSETLFWKLWGSWADGRHSRARWFIPSLAHPPAEPTPLCSLPHTRSLYISAAPCCARPCAVPWGNWVKGRPGAHPQEVHSQAARAGSAPVRSESRVCPGAGGARGRRKEHPWRHLPKEKIPAWDLEQVRCGVNAVGKSAASPLWMWFSDRPAPWSHLEASQHTCVWSHPRGSGLIGLQWGLGHLYAF